MSSCQESGDIVREAMLLTSQVILMISTQLLLNTHMKEDAPGIIVGV